MVRAGWWIAATILGMALGLSGGVVAAFSGSLTDANHLTGTLSYSNDGTGSITFALQ